MRSLNPTSHNGANFVITGNTGGCHQYDGKAGIMKTFEFQYENMSASSNIDCKMEWYYFCYLNWCIWYVTILF